VKRYRKNENNEKLKWKFARNEKPLQKASFVSVSRRNGEEGRKKARRMCYSVLSNQVKRRSK
jgi:hypothetical protein